MGTKSSESKLPEDWCEEQRILYRRIFRYAGRQQKAFLSPGDIERSDRHWLTLCHNFAYAAAELLVDEEVTLVDPRTGEVVARTPRELDS